jgi:hypothetical protein
VLILNVVIEEFPSIFVGVDFKGLNVEIVGAPYCRDKYQLRAECYLGLPEI